MALSPFTTPPKDTWLGLASLLKTSKRIYFTYSWSYCVFIVAKQQFNTHPETDNGNSMITLTFTLTEARLSCTLVLKENKIHQYKTILLSIHTHAEHLYLYHLWQLLRLELQVNVNLRGVQRHTRSAQDDVKCSLMEINKNKKAAASLTWKYSSRVSQWTCEA